MTARRVVAGRYRLEERIGSGAMGVVWRGTDERLGRPVAVKQVFLHGGLDATEADEVRQRTLREGRIAARLQHPHAISVFDASIDGDEPWLVMEYLPSRSLAAVLAEHGTLEPRLVARIGRQVADALDAAHQAGIVHRDVKPGNVLIGADGTVKITDFGISRASGDLTLTRTGMLAGTPAYLAPEVARGDDSSSASDVFSLGATLYAAVEGVPPFGADDNALALLHAVAAGAVHPPLQAGPLTALLMRLLRSDPTERPSAADARQTLGRIAATGSARTAGRPGEDRDESDGAGMTGFGVAAGEHTGEHRGPPGGAAAALGAAGRPGDPAPGAAASGPHATRRAVPGATQPWAEAPGDASTRSADPAGAPGAAGAAARAPGAAPGSGTGSLAAVGVGRGSRASRAVGARPSRRVAVAVLVAAVVAGIVVGLVLVLSRAAAPSTAPAATPGASAPAAAGADRARTVAAVRDYYATVTANSGAGWARLGPGLQAGAGGFTAYQSFWSTMSSARVGDAAVVDGDTVRATVVFSPRDRTPIQEVHDLGLVRGGDGGWLVDSDRLVSD